MEKFQGGGGGGRDSYTLHLQSRYKRKEMCFPTGVVHSGKTGEISRLDIANTSICTVG